MADSQYKEEVIRRSERENRGVPPEKYGDYFDGTIQDLESPHPRFQSTPINKSTMKEERTLALKKEDLEDDNKSRSSVKSTASLIRRKKLEAMLEVKKAKARINLEVLDMEEELEMAKIDEEFGSEDDGSMNRDLDVRSVSSGKESKKESFVSAGPGEIKDAKVLQWVNKTVHENQEANILQDLNILQSPIVPQAKDDLLSPKVLHSSKPILTTLQEVHQSSTAKDDYFVTSKQLLVRKSMGKDLPYFSGNPNEWSAFIYRYKRSTEACGFSPDENLQRLERCLKGEAKEVVRFMLCNPDMVDAIIAKLEKCYGDPTLQIKSMIKKLEKLQVIKEGNPEGIVELSRTLNSIVVTAKSIGKMDYLENPLLMEDIMKKLSYSQKVQWKKEVHEGKYQDSVKDLAAWLEILEDIAFKLKQQSSSENKEYSQIEGGTHHERNPRRDNQNNFRDKNRDLRNKGRVFTANEVKREEKKSDSKELCLYCEKGSHSLEDCRGFKVLEVSRKSEWVTKKNLCFCCLKGGHRVSNCNKKKFCTAYGCKSSHHPLLHVNYPPRESSVKIESSNLIHENRRVLLSVLPVVLKNNLREVFTYALLDSGSTVTMLDEDVAKELQVEGIEDPLHVTWMNNKADIHHKSRRVSIGIKGAQGSQTFKLENVRTMKNLQLPRHTNNSRELIKKWDHLRDINIQDMKDAKVKMIIGNDNLNISVPLETRKGPKTAPIASRTELGWLIHGKISFVKSSSSLDRVCCCYEPPEEDLHKLVKASFTTENFGVKISSQNLKSKEDIKAEEKFVEITRRVGERWESGLLWRNPQVKLPESKIQALTRLQSMEKKIDRNKEFADQYNVQVEGYIKKGYARKLSKEEASIHTEKTWYLPHFAVRHPHKPGKVRVVFDAAAKNSGTSLNDQLFTGPDNLNSLVGSLFKFREGTIGFTGDIKEMFHQIKMRNEDCSAQRFLWRGANRDRDPDVYEMQVLIFGGVSSPYVAGEVKNRNALEFQQEFPEAVKAITDKHYVDDYLDSCNSEDQAIKLINEVKEVHRRGGFEIGKWACNSTKVMRGICSSEEGPAVKEMDNSDSTTQRVLGLKWDPEADKFTFSLNFHRVKEGIISGVKNPTKREILKLVMSVFDPLGFLSCFTMKARVLLQEVWKTGIGWDDELPEELKPKWLQWIKELESITKVQIPRCHTTLISQVKSIHLHVFCDASQKAFSAVGYFRFEYENKVDTSFVMSKTRVAPINVNSMSIPRLELQAAVLGSRLASTIKDLHSFKIDEIHFWSDSTTVLGWIRATTKRFKQFVGHRIGEILETSDVNQWHWVPTDLNVADDATRDEKLCDLSKDSRWWRGPGFLKENSSNWPVENHNVKSFTDELDPVIEKEYLMVCVDEVNIFDPRRHSTWLKLVRSTAWVFRFISKLRKKSEMKGELLPKEIEEAEMYWFKRAQNESFPEDIDLLKNSKPLKNSNKLKKFSPVLDEHQVVRMRSRIVNSPDIKEETQRPIILDPNHRVTYLLVQHYHKKNLHIGSESVVNQVRKKFWIFNLRSLVRGVQASCQSCKNQRAKPQIPEMAELPEVRVTRQERAFMITGLDYFGPIEVSVGRRKEKRYGALFTCLSTRAVHIEVADSLTTDSAIMAVRRFMNIRGQPKQIFSDNGTNFKGANNELKRALEELDHNKMTSILSNEGIDWKFIPPLSPHMGGAWERLVKSIKSAAAKVFKELAPKEEVLRTTLSEAAYCVNSHPLTYVSSNPEDPESLTPNHFLIGPKCIVHPMGKFSKEDIWTRRWRASQALADVFWRRWVKEYLPTLGRRSKWNQEVTPIKVGDICIQIEDNQPRNEWQKCKVIEVHPGRDGRIRVVDIRMFDRKKNKMKMFTRPVARLCVLDCQEKTSQEKTSQEKISEDEKTQRPIG